MPTVSLPLQVLLYPVFTLARRDSCGLLEVPDQVSNFMTGKRI